MTEAQRRVWINQIGDLLSDVQQFANRCLYHLDHDSPLIAKSSLEAARDKLGMAIMRVQMILHEKHDEELQR